MRIAPTISIPRVLEHLGFEPASTLAELGFDIHLFDDAENFIPFLARNRLLEQCADITGCRHFGHLVARSSSPSSFGLSGFLIQQAPDVAAALEALVRHLHLHVDGAVGYLERDSDVAFMGYSILRLDLGPTDQVTDAAVTALFNIIKKLCGDTWSATELLFTHAGPENPRPMQRYFDAPLKFNAGKNGVVFPASWLEQPVLGADPDLGLHLQRQIDLIESRHSDDFAEQVRRVIHSAVLTHQASAQHVANLFSVHERTLNRRLNECGTCFRKLLDECHFDLARQLLTNPSLSIRDVSESLDYSDTSAFARAFRRQSGVSPSAWRAEVCQGNT